MSEFSSKELRSISRKPKLMCRILTYIEENDGPIKINELEIDAPKIEVHRQLQILEEEGYLGDDLDKDTSGVPYLFYSNPDVRRGIEELCGGAGEWMKERIQKGTEKGVEKAISKILYAVIAFLAGAILLWLLGWL